MARERIPAGGWGKINHITWKGKPAVDVWYRDSAGVRRRMRRTGSTPAQAERALRGALENISASAVRSTEDLLRDFPHGDAQSLAIELLAATLVRDGAITPETWHRAVQAAKKEEVSDRG